MIGLDTSAIIDIFRDNPKIKSIIENQQEPLATTLLNYQELLFGLDLTFAKHKEEARIYDDLMHTLHSYPLDMPSAKKAAELYWNLRKSGQEIGKFDCMIAGTLIANGVKRIITKNKRHFAKIKELQVLSY